MMNQPQSSVLKNLLEHPGLRKIEREGQTRYAAADVIGLLTDTREPEEMLEALKAAEPSVDCVCEVGEVHDRQGGTVMADTVSLAGLFRLVQSLQGKRAERVKRWLSLSAQAHLQEADNPELAVLRARRIYQRHGHSRKWIDTRLRAMSTRQELVGEWYRRGARDSEDFRLLTNELMHGIFGMDVQGYREAKHARGSLRDNMNDWELVLTTLAESTAAGLHRAHNSSDLEQLLRDVRQAGQIVAQIRQQMEQQAAATPAA